MGLSETVLEALSTPVAVLDGTGRIVDDNASWRRFTDRDDHPLVPVEEPYLDGLAASDDDRATAVATRLRSLLDGNTARGRVYESHVDADDGAFVVRLGSVDHDGDRYAVVTCVERPSQSRIATDLRLKERAMDEAPVGITISDPEQEDNPVVYANAAFERITGYPTEEVLGRNCRFLQGEDTDPETVATMRRAIENWNPVTVDVRNYRRNGEEFWNEVTIAPLHDDDGEPSHFVGFQRDVTDRKQAERELETERDRLAVLNQIVRHDIRNDMTVALGWGSELAEDIDSENEAALERVLTAATHTKELTDAVGDLVGILGTTDPELESVRVDTVLRREVERVRSTFDYRSQSLTVRGDETLPETRVWATSILASVFGNVLDNAVFHNDKDAIEIDVDIDVGGASAVVRIADNGPGIPDARKREVFGRGEKGLESPGSGLGLYLVDNLVDTYGGSVWIEDNDPEGAVLCIELRSADGQSYLD
ncbi:PAS domain-containing protein [Haloplanus salilacus]|uniref:PAS domain-containing protein n=1 Tax=Haloplanus salilacus TaxID=2949994 RepID=UPI0030D4D25A